MTKKDFVALAAAIAQIQDEADRKKIAQAIGNVCLSQNPRFDWGRWDAACRV